MRFAFYFVYLFLIVQSVNAQIDTSNLRTIIQKKIDKEQFSGTVLIAEKGRAVLQVTSGYRALGEKEAIHNHTTFAIASITKMLTAIVVLQLVEEGRLQLTDKLSDLLPEYSLPKSDSITVHHLLLHISGLPNEPEAIYQKPLTQEEFVQRAVKANPVQTFGQFNYNNLDYVLLGLITEKKTGLNWQASIQRRIIDKLHLTSTGFLQRQRLPSDFAKGYLVTKAGKPVKEPLFHIENFFAAGSMYSNAEDLLKIDQALFGDELLNEESKKRMYTSYPQYNYTGYSVWTYNYPFADTHPKIMERRGGIYGSNSVLVRFLDDNKTIIILSNNDAFNPDSFGDKNNLREALIIALTKNVRL